MQLEIDTLRVPVDEAVRVFGEQVLPALREQPGYEGVLVLTNPEGKGMVVSFWETETDAVEAAGFGTEAVERLVTLFRAPPGRDRYEVAVAEVPGELLAVGAA